MELAQKLENPKRANLFQRIGTYCHIEKLPSEEAVKTYIESRLRLAGTQEKIFSDDAIPIIWEFSEHGVPRLINKICKLCLKAGETNEFKIISGEVASQIADRFQKLSKITSHKRKSQSLPEIEPSKEDISVESEVKELKKKPKSSIPKKAIPKVKASSTPIPSQQETIPGENKEVPPVRVTSTNIPSQLESIPGETKEMSPKHAPSVTIPLQSEALPVQKKAVPTVQSLSSPIPFQPETTTAETEAASTDEAPSVSVPLKPEIIPVEKKAVPPLRAHSTDIPLQQGAKTIETKAVPLARTFSTYVPLQQEASTVETEVASQIQSSLTREENEEQPAKAERRVYEEVLIGKQKVKMSIPDNIISQAKLANSESKNKLAGYWSAQVIKENPHVMHSPLIDPVSIWFEIKNVILNKFNGTSTKN
jgi:hypothetical protein